MSPLKKLALVIAATAAFGAAAPAAAFATTWGSPSQSGGTCSTCVTWSAPTDGVNWG